MLSLHEREQSRLAVSRLAKLLESIEESLEQGTPLAPDVSFLLGQLTQSSDRETQHRAIEEWLDTTKQNYRDKLRANAQKSLSCFAEFMNMEEPPARHHEWMCKKLEAVANRSIMRMMLSMPPGHAKSTYCTHLFPAWYLGNNPKHKYIQAGHTQDFVDEEFGKKVRGIIDSEDFREVFPDVRLDPGSKAASRFALAKHKGKYLGRGVGQGISGFRANIAAVDDPFASREDVESPTIRKKVFDWFMADLTTRLLPRSPLFIVATRWHTDDLCGRMEALAAKNQGLPWEIINLPAIAEDENDPLGRILGEPLWPSFYSADFLYNLKSTLPSRDWNSLYQGTPMDVAGSTFNIDWVKRYDDYPKNERDSSGVHKMNVRRMTVSVDCASKTGERNDYTAIGVWIEDVQRRHYLVEVVRERLEFNEMVEAIEDAVDRWNARKIGVQVSAILVEDKGSGTQYIQTRRGKAPAPVVAIEVGTNSKEFRFDGVCPMFEAGEVFLPNAAGWLPDYEKELLGFPNAAKDDQVDMTSQYLAWARRRGAGGTRKLGGTGIPNNLPQRGGARLGGSRTGNFSQAAAHTPSAKIGG